jgi:hypothetical protein
MHVWKCHNEAHYFVQLTYADKKHAEMFLKFWLKYYFASSFQDPAVNKRFPWMPFFLSTDNKARCAISDNIPSNATIAKKF